MRTVVKKIDGLKMTWDELTTLIMKLNAWPDEGTEENDENIDEVLEFTGFHFKLIIMEHDGYGVEGRYTWSAEYNYGVAGIAGYLFPMRSNEYVKHFKTLNGARKNLIRNISWMKDQFKKVDENVKGT